MWLLSTDRAELRFFSAVEDVEDGYAILSHVWGADEQTFQDLQALRNTCATGGRNPRDLASDKIRNCCLLAERHGHRWLWVDTCCIDKSSSSELSEAINSMFRWYAQAEVCYAYLVDVPGNCDLLAANSELRASLWHTRGWTLQELVAPALVIFLSCDWEVLGTKAELAELLENITNVPSTVLKMQEALADISIARRMSWAAKRKTTRPEDEAYCLLGIFGIHIPTLYGEGKQAFQRLQKEIMKKLIDTSLFAWGSCLVFRGFTYDHEADSTHGVCEQPFLFATSPSDFDGNVYFNPPRPDTEQLSRSKIRNIVRMRSSLMGMGTIGLPSLSNTPYGVHVRAPVFEAFGYTVAVLFCCEDDEHLGLFLTPSLDPADPSRPLYHAGAFAFGRSARTVTLGDKLDSLRFNGRRVTPSWRELYISHRPPLDIGQGPHVLMNISLSTPFRIPQRVIRSLSQHGLELVSISNVELPWTGHSPVTLVFVSSTGGFMLHLGRCTSRRSDPARGPPRAARPDPHWAHIQFYDTRTHPEPRSDHSCPADHVCEWRHSTRSFEWPNALRHFEQAENDLLNWLPNSTVTLSFSSSPMSRAETLVVNLAVDLRAAPNTSIRS